MDKRIVEINGVKLEIDLSQARVVENYRVGDNVKVLIKKYTDQYESLPGVIVGFDSFEKLPTIVIAYLEMSYNAAEIKFVYFNANTKDTEICQMVGKEVPFAHDRVLEMMNRQIENKETELADLKRKKEFFLAEFGSYFLKDVKVSL